jgi:hypothetical protein
MRRVKVRKPVFAGSMRDSRPQPPSLRARAIAGEALPVAIVRAVAAGSRDLQFSPETP